MFLHFCGFSWDDLAAKDLPAMIDFVLERTEKKQLCYIGHSQVFIVKLI